MSKRTWAELVHAMNVEKEDPILASRSAINSYARFMFFVGILLGTAFATALGMIW